MKLKVAQISESAFSVQGHGVHTAFTETVRGLRASKKATVWENSFQKSDIRHIHTVGPYSLFHLLLGSGKKVVSAHVVPESFIGSLIGAKYWLGFAKFYLRWFYNRAHVVIAVSDDTKANLEQLGVKKPIKVIYNMVDTSRYKFTKQDKKEARKQLGIRDDAVVVIGNGQVQPRKRVDTFINIAKKLPELKFIWVGGMPFGRVAADHEKMQRLIDEAPDNVTFTGVVSLDEVQTYFSVGDIFVMSSEQETFGLAIVEAAASGLPVVLRNIRDYDDTFRGDAIMCNESEFSKEVQKLSDSRDYYSQAKKRSAKIAKRFDSTTITAQLLAVYESSLGLHNDDIIENK